MPEPDHSQMLAGGCQCGSVRYRLQSPPTKTSICWCRMCQRASGSYLAAFSTVAEPDLVWTRGTPGAFRSSEAAERHFCRDCGTPLTYHHLTGGAISVATATLDEPAAAPPPTKQFFVEHRPDFAEGLCGLAVVETASWQTPDIVDRYRPRQNPDRSD